MKTNLGKNLKDSALPDAIPQLNMPRDSVMKRAAKHRDPESVALSSVALIVAAVRGAAGCAADLLAHLRQRHHGDPHREDAGGAAGSRDSDGVVQGGK